MSLNTITTLLVYDKLKPYGFPIHGAIDGFSPRVLWLQVVKSNNDPNVPAHLYFECVRDNHGCPLLLWSVCGAENGLAASMQCYFKALQGDDVLARENRTDMALLMLTNGLRTGGPFFGVADQAGGSIILNTLSTMAFYTTWE